MPLQSGHGYHISNEFITEYNYFYTIPDAAADYAYLHLGYHSNSEHIKKAIDSDTPQNFSQLNNASDFPIYSSAIKSRSDYFPPFVFNLNLQKYSHLPLEAVTNYYRSKQNGNTPTSLFPIATRYVSESGLFAIERPPFQADIDFKVGRASSRTKKRLDNIKVWIPWTIFVFNPNIPNYYKYYFSNSSLTDSNHKYIAPYIPNTYTSGDICFSNSLANIPEDSVPNSSDVTHLYATIFNDFFTGGWNSDLTNPWQYVYNALAAYIASNTFDDAVSEYPFLTELFHPTDEYLLSFYSSSSKIKNLHKSISSLNRTKYSIYSYLEYTDFHHLLLATLSTYDLPRILALVEEATRIHDAVSTSSIVKFATTFESIVSSSETNKTLDYSDTIYKKAKNLFDYSTANGDVIYDYTNLSTKILFLNFIENDRFPVSYPFYNSFCETIMLHFPKNLFSSLVHRIMNDSANGLNISNRIYVCDNHNPDYINSHPYNSELVNPYRNLIINDFDISTLLSSQVSVS